MPRRRPRAMLVALGVLALGAAAGIGWAGARVFAEPGEVLTASPYTQVTVSQGEVGSELSLNTVAAWSPRLVGTNLAAGTVTEVLVEPGQEVTQGTALYTVDLRPVVIALGEIPAFRDLTPDARGADVAQLQEMLAATGHYDGPADGRWGASTTAAVRAWQSEIGASEPGTVRASDIIFVTDLPTRITLDAAVQRGARLGGDEAAVLGLSSQPDFRIPVTASQAALMPTGTRVEITSPDGGLWTAHTADQTTDEGGQVVVDLAGIGDDPICGQDCGSIPADGQALLASRIVTVETVSGLTVPSAALRSAPDGTVSVVQPDGTEHRVTVLASARGMSAIEGEGVTGGLVLRAPASGS